MVSCVQAMALQGLKRRPVLQLPLFQPDDALQMRTLHDLLGGMPELCHYYLRELVFPQVSPSPLRSFYPTST